MYSKDPSESSLKIALSLYFPISGELVVQCTGDLQVSQIFSPLKIYIRLAPLLLPWLSGIPSIPRDFTHSFRGFSCHIISVTILEILDSHPSDQDVTVTPSLTYHTQGGTRGTCPSGRKHWPSEQMPAVHTGATPPWLPDEHKQARQRVPTGTHTLQIVECWRERSFVHQIILDHHSYSESWHPHQSPHLSGFSLTSDTMRYLPNSHLLPFSR